MSGAGTLAMDPLGPMGFDQSGLFWRIPQMLDLIGICGIWGPGHLFGVFHEPFLSRFCVTGQIVCWGRPLLLGSAVPPLRLQQCLGGWRMSRFPSRTLHCYEMINVIHSLVKGFNSVVYIPIIGF